MHFFGQRAPVPSFEHQLQRIALMHFLPHKLTPDVLVVIFSLVGVMPSQEGKLSSKLASGIISFHCLIALGILKLKILNRGN